VSSWSQNFQGVAPGQDSAVLIQSRRIQVYAAYYQFHVQDGKYVPGAAADLWTGQALSDRLAILPGVVGVGTASYDIVDVLVEIHDEAPVVEPAVWDHVTEADLYVAGGGIQIVGCLDSLRDPVQLFAAPPGNYRIGCCHANLAAAAVDGIPDRPAGDWYVVGVWPASPAPPVVLKRFNAPQGPDTGTASSLS